MNSTIGPSLDDERTKLLLSGLDAMSFKLERYSILLGNYGMIVILLTAVHLVLVAIRLLGTRVDLFLPSQLASIVSLMLFMFVLVAALARDTLSKRSQALFDELTSLLQAAAEDARRREQTFWEYSRVRQVTRAYAMSIDYPLIPGRSGGAVLILVNIILLVLTSSGITAVRYLQ